MRLIEGYKNLKIHLFLSPVYWNPLFKISYSSKDPKVKTVEEYFQNFFGGYFNTDQSLFEG